MRTFEPITLVEKDLTRELDELEHFLKQNPQLRERKHVLPFFKARKQLCAALGLMNANVDVPDRVANELVLFGDFACDAAAGDSKNNSFTLIEFEDANEHSIFSKLETGKSVKRWSSRFEHGFSQLVDWAWRLSRENATTTAFRDIFGKNHAKIHLLLVAGRDADLTDD